MGDLSAHTFTRLILGGHRRGLTCGFSRWFPLGFSRLFHGLLLLGDLRGLLRGHPCGNIFGFMPDYKGPALKVVANISYVLDVGQQCLLFGLMFADDAKIKVGPRLKL